MGRGLEGLLALGQLAELLLEVLEIHAALLERSIELTVGLHHIGIAGDDGAGPGIERVPYPGRHIRHARVVDIVQPTRVALRSFYRVCTERICPALSLGQTLGVVRDGDTLMLARLLTGMIREPVFQVWLYGEDLDTRGLVSELARTVKGGMLR